MRQRWALLVSTTAVLAIAGVSFFLVRNLTAQSPPPPPPGSLQERYPEILEDNAKPRFQGELLGIYLGTPDVRKEKGYLVDVKELCPGGFDVVQDHPSVPEPPGYLPPGAFQPVQYPAALEDEPNPGALACRDSGKPYTSWRYVEFAPLEDGLRPWILLNRVFMDRPYRTIDAPEDRIEVVTLGGRQVIVIKPVVPQGGTDAAVTQVIIPEPSGYLVVQGVILPFEEVMRVAESPTGGGPVPTPPTGAPTPSAPPFASPAAGATPSPPAPTPGAAPGGPSASPSPSPGSRNGP